MHYRSLLFVELPETKKDPEWEQEVQEKLDALKTMHPGKVIESAIRSLHIGQLVNLQTSFGRELTHVVYEAMERFYSGTKDPRYLEFEDRTEEFRTDFEREVDCVVMPDGRIREIDDYPIWRQFIIRDGLVYQKEAGPLRHPKRTKKAKKMKALPCYPRKKVYASFEEFVKDFGGVKNEATGQYGQWYNPDSVYDWFSIGGRWPEMFLVKQDCQEYSYGERRVMDENKHPAPEGYRWVACARKRDIQWDVMRQYRNQQAERQFQELEAMFQSGEVTPYTPFHIKEDGIYRWGEQVYRKGQTLQEFMEKSGIPTSWKYPISVYGIFIDEAYYSKDDAIYDKELCKWVQQDWQTAMDKHIDEADDDTVFVGIDYHM